MSKSKNKKKPQEKSNDNVNKNQKNIPWAKIIIAICVLFAVLLSFYMNNLDKNKDSKDPKEDEDKLNIYFFYSKTCPHCKEEEKLFEELYEKFKNINILEYEISDKKSLDLYFDLTKDLKDFDNSTISVPVTIIGSQHVRGYYTRSTTGEKIINMIEEELLKNVSQN